MLLAIRRRLGSQASLLMLLLLAGLAASLCAYYVNSRGLVVVAAVGLTVLLGLCWPWVSVQGIRGSWEFAKSHATEGQEVMVRVHVRNRWPWAVCGLLFPAVSPVNSQRANSAAGETDDSPLLPMLAGWTAVTKKYAFCPPVRGDYPNQPPQVVTAFPLGVLTCKKSLTASTRLLVWPKIYPVGDLVDESRRSGLEGEQWGSVAGEGGEVIGTRPYRRGDTLRRIHWAQTARQGQLITRERQAPAMTRVGVLLDVDPRVHRGEGPDGSREWAIRIAASLLAGILQQGGQVELISGSPGVGLRRGRQPTSLSRWLDQLARIQPDEGGRLLDLLAANSTIIKGSVVWVVTTQASLLQAAATDQASLLSDDRLRFLVLREEGFASFSEEAKKKLPKGDFSPPDHRWLGWQQRNVRQPAWQHESGDHESGIHESGDRESGDHGSGDREAWLPWEMRYRVAAVLEGPGEVAGILQTLGPSWRTRLVRESSHVR